MRDILAGVALIAIGLVFGGSVFLGDFSITSILFDALGVFFIIRGLIKMNRAKHAGTASPAAPPPTPPPSRPR
jgi:hypothetical protein